LIALDYYLREEWSMIVEWWLLHWRLAKKANEELILGQEVAAKS
jgi:hypothetical protein